MKIKFWHIVEIIFLSIIIYKYDLLANSFVMQIDFIKLLFTNFSVALSQIDFAFVDYNFSALLIIIIPIVIFIFRKTKVLNNISLNYTNIVITIILLFFVFAPFVALTNPDLQKDIRVTKLLSPFSSVTVLHKKDDKKVGSNNFEIFIASKNKVIEQSFNDGIIYVDSFSTAESIVTYFQKKRSFNIETDKLKLDNGKPIVTSKLFILGTDQFGRDILSRVIYGTRLSLFVGISAVFIAFVTGLLFGFLAGYKGGFTDVILNRFTEMFLAFPILFLIIFIIAMFDSSIFSVILVLGLSGWMGLFKIVRAEVINLKNKEFFISAKLIGLSSKQMFFKETLPNIIAPIVVNLVFLYGNVILAEAALSFLGLSSGDGYPSWGSMIQDGQSYITIAWWMILFPGLMLFITLLTANQIGKKIDNHFNKQILL